MLTGSGWHNGLQNNLQFQQITIYFYLYLCIMSDESYVIFICILVPLLVWHVYGILYNYRILFLRMCFHKVLFVRINVFIFSQTS